MSASSIALKMKHGPSSTQLQADFVFPGTWDEFIGDDFYWSQFSLGRLHRLPNKINSNQDCLAPYVGADFTEYQWRRCRTMIGEKPKRPDCILCVFKAYSASKKY